MRIAENLSTGHRGEAKSLVKALLKPFACTGATDIAANSRLAAEWLYGKRAERCRIIRNPVDIAFFQNDPGERFEVRSRLGLGGSFVVGWIGRCVPQKNPLFLADILSALVARDPDVCMVVVGYGPLEGRLKDRIVALGLSESFVALGETEDIRPLYRAMDCFVLPSLYEGLPMVSVEAQAAGLPCVLSSEITREAAVGEGVAFVGLDRAANEWADTLLSFKGVGRLDNRLALHACGFDAAVSAADLDAFWRGLLRREAGRR